MFFGQFRMKNDVRTIECADGTVKVLTIRNNPGDLSNDRVLFNGRKIKVAEMNHLFQRDCNRPWMSENVG
jgi:hypothetical protein